MNRRVLMLVGVLLLAGGLGALARVDPGYVWIGWQGYSLETSLAFALVLLLVLVLLLRLLLLLLRLPVSGGRRWREWRHGRQLQKEQGAASEGYQALLEGRWKAAQKALQRAARNNDMPLGHWLAAARAAHGGGDLAARDAFLDAALASAPEASLGLTLERSELQLEAGQLDAARASLEALETGAADNPRRLRLLAETLAAQADWPALKTLLPKLEKQKCLAPERLQTLQRLVAEHEQQAPPETAEQEERREQED